MEKARAEQELSDAWKQIGDGEQALADGKRELAGQGNRNWKKEGTNYIQPEAGRWGICTDSGRGTKIKPGKTGASDSGGTASAKKSRI